MCWNVVRMCETAYLKYLRSYFYNCIKWNYQCNYYYSNATYDTGYLQRCIMQLQQAEDVYLLYIKNNMIVVFPVALKILTFHFSPLKWRDFVFGDGEKIKCWFIWSRWTMKHFRLFFFSSQKLWQHWNMHTLKNSWATMMEDMNHPQYACFKTHTLVIDVSTDSLPSFVDHSLVAADTLSSFDVK